MQPTEVAIATSGAAWSETHRPGRSLGPGCASFSPFQRVRQRSSFFSNLWSIDLPELAFATRATDFATFTPPRDKRSLRRLDQSLVPSSVRVSSDHPDLTTLEIRFIVSTLANELGLRSIDAFATLQVTHATLQVTHATPCSLCPPEELPTRFRSSLRVAALYTRDKERGARNQRF